MTDSTNDDLDDLLSFAGDVTEEQKAAPVAKAEPEAAPVKRGPGRPPKAKAEPAPEKAPEPAPAAAPDTTKDDLIAELTAKLAAAEAATKAAQLNDTALSAAAEVSPSLAEMKKHVVTNLEPGDRLARPLDQAGAEKYVSTNVPKTEGELTPEERRIRELENALAIKNAKDFDEAPDVFEEVSDENPYLIHIVTDGFTAQGHVWYKGQEIAFGKEAFAQTLDRNGRSWLEDSEYEQILRSGEVQFRPGPWPGLPFQEAAAAEAERRRNRAAPLLNLQTK